MKRLLFGIVLFLALLHPATAQVPVLQEEQIRMMFKDNPGLAAGTKAMYREPFEPHAAVPKGYKAFYISHYGRHGARLETRSEPYDYMYKFLEEAHMNEALTDYGEGIYRRFKALYPSLQNSRGDLTFKGQAQHKGIADRMVTNYPSVFKGKAHVWASSSVVPRCVISMASFLEQLHARNSKLLLTYSANMADMHYNALVYEDYPNAEDLERLKKTSEFMSLANEILGKDIELEPFFMRICKSMDYVNAHGGLAAASYFWSIAGNMQCLDTEENFNDLFTEDEAYYMWRYSNISYAAMVGRTPLTEGISPFLAQSLLQQILNHAEEDIATGKTDVRLRFGHDTTVGPLMSLLGIEGWTEIVSEPEELAAKVHSFDIPMASNLQFVFYRNKRNPDDILLRLMYNEKDQILPLQDQSMAPYYKWQDFREHYQNVCENARQQLKAAEAKVRQNPQ